MKKASLGAFGNFYRHSIENILCHIIIKSPLVCSNKIIEISLPFLVSIKLFSCSINEHHGQLARLLSAKDGCWYA